MVGVYLTSGQGNTVGGTAAGAGNVIAGSLFCGRSCHLRQRRHRPGQFHRDRRYRHDQPWQLRRGHLQGGGGNLTTNTYDRRDDRRCRQHDRFQCEPAASVSIGTTILGNSIFGNNGEGIGTGNISPPTLTGATSTSITGTFAFLANSTSRLEFFATPDTGSPFDNAQGKTFLGTMDVTTDINGLASFTFTPAGGVPVGQFLTVTATNAPFGTSIFSHSIQTHAGGPDLQISLSDGATSTTPGSTLTYTLSYANAGSQAATGVQLTETLPTGTTFSAAASTAGWTQTAPGSGIYKLTIGNLAVGSGSAVFVVNVNNPAPQGMTQIVNTASIADDGAHGTDLTPANNTATDTDSLSSLSTDVSVGNVASSATTHAGDNLTFTLEVHNLGNNPAAGVTLTDAIPTGTTFASFTAPAGWTVITPAVGGTGMITVTRSSLATGASGTFQLVVRVNTAATVGAIITNSAQVATTTTDSNPNNNSASATSQVVLQTSTRLTFTLSNRLADYRSELGLFIVDDANGLIGALRPGDRGYAQAALSRRQFYFNRLAKLGHQLHTRSARRQVLRVVSGSEQFQCPIPPQESEQ